MAKAPGSNAIRLPVNAFVEVHQPVLDRRRADEPAIDWVLHERRALPPIVRIVVEVRVLSVEQPTRREVADDWAVGVLEPHPPDLAESFPERAVRLDRIQRWEPMFLPRQKVIRTKSWRGMDDARPVFRCHVVRCDDSPCSIRSKLLCERRPHGFVALSDQISARKLSNDFVIAFQRCLRT